MTTAQDFVNELTSRISSGVQELRDEIRRLASLPPEQVDFSGLIAIADGLAADNIPADPAPPVEGGPVSTPTPQEPQF